MYLQKIHIGMQTYKTLTLEGAIEEDFATYDPSTYKK